MNIQTEKLDIIQCLAGVNESKVIRQFMLLKRTNEEMTSIVLSEAEKHAIDKGIQSIEAGRVKSHEEVMEITRKKYPQLFKWFMQVVWSDEATVDYNQNIDYLLKEWSEQVASDFIEDVDTVVGLIKIYP